MYTSQPCRQAGSGDVVVCDDYVKTRYPEVYARAQALKQADARNELEIQSKQTELPPWPDVVRGVPNSVLRTALFCASSGTNQYLERAQIHAQEGISIVYSGVRLGQLDLDVWLTVIHVARLQSLGLECRVSAYLLLKKLEKTDSGSNRQTLDRCLSRLKATALEVKVGKFSYEGSLIDEVFRSEEKGYVIRLNPKLISLFGDGQFTQLDWEVRRKLRCKPLAQWLHGYYSSHAKPHPVKLATLLKLAGSTNSNAGSGKQTIQKALAAVRYAASSSNQHFRFQICGGDLVHVDKSGTGSQSRHLARRSAPIEYRRVK